MYSPSHVAKFFSTCLKKVLKQYFSPQRFQKCRIIRNPELNMEDENNKSKSSGSEYNGHPGR